LGAGGWVREDSSWTTGNQQSDSKATIERLKVNSQSANHPTKILRFLSQGLAKLQVHIISMLASFTREDFLGLANFHDLAWDLTNHGYFS
jgi:hypothetical protein